MLDILEKLVTQLLGQANSGVVTILLMVVGYLGWMNYTAHKEHKSEVEKYQQSLQLLQETINKKTGEERDMLLAIIDKYHQSQISIREAIGEIKAVLTALSSMK